MKFKVGDKVRLNAAGEAYIDRCGYGAYSPAGLHEVIRLTGDSYQLENSKGATLWFAHEHLDADTTTDSITLTAAERLIYTTTSAHTQRIEEAAQAELESAWAAFLSVLQEDHPELADKTRQQIEVSEDGSQLRVVE